MVRPVDWHFFSVRSGATDIQLLNSLYRIAKYVGFKMPFKCTNFDINRNVVKDYIPYSDSFVPKIPFSQFGTTTRNMQQIWLPCIVLMNIRGFFFQTYEIHAAVDHGDICIKTNIIHTYTLLTERTQSELNSGSLWALLLAPWIIRTAFFLQKKYFVNVWSIGGTP